MKPEEGMQVEGVREKWVRGEGGGKWRQVVGLILKYQYITYWQMPCQQPVRYFDFFFWYVRVFVLVSPSVSCVTVFQSLPRQKGNFFHVACPPPLLGPNSMDWSGLSRSRAPCFSSGRSVDFSITEQGVAREECSDRWPGDFAIMERGLAIWDPLPGSPEKSSDRRPAA